VIRASVAGIGWLTAGGLGRSRAGDPYAAPPGNLPHVSRRDLFDQPDTRFGRLDPFCRTGLAAAVMALRDAGAPATAAGRVGAVVSTLFGTLATDRDYLATAIPDRGAQASPNLFAYTLPNVLLGEAAIRFHLVGPTYVVSGSRPGHLDALREALSILAAGEAEAMLAGFCDVPPPDTVPMGADFLSGALFLYLEPAGGNSLGVIEAEGEVVRFGGRTIENLSDLPTLAGRPTANDEGDPS
jgi:3-oxoacyl-[acyl-carrier-protein] synthase II